MGLIAFIISLAALGLVVGGLGRLALPGPDPMTIPQTIGIGLAGSFIGGFLTSLISGRQAWNMIVAVACATAIVYLIRRSRGGTLTDPGLGGRRPR